MQLDFVASKMTSATYNLTDKAMRPLLTDQQCRIALDGLREFGYPTLSFEEVRRAADEIHAGASKATDVIAVMLQKIIDDTIQT